MESKCGFYSIPWNFLRHLPFIVCLEGARPYFCRILTRKSLSRSPHRFCLCMIPSLTWLLWLVLFQATLNWRVTTCIRTPMRIPFPFMEEWLQIHILDWDSVLNRHFIHLFSVSLLGNLIHELIKPLFLLLVYCLYVFWVLEMPHCIQILSPCCSFVLLL